MSTLLDDLRFSLRSLGRTPGFTITASLVLALGIGLNVAVFAAANALLLKPLGGSAEGELTGIYIRERARPDSYQRFSYAAYRAIRDHQGPVSGVLAQELATVGVTSGDTSRRAFAALVSANYFSTLGVRPALGRDFRRDEEQVGAPLVAILSHRYWRQHGSDPRIPGSSLRVNGRDVTIVGVAPPTFSGATALFAPDLWLPLGACSIAGAGAADREATTCLADDGRRTLSLVGRLQAGETRAAAAASLAGLSFDVEGRTPGARVPGEIVVGSVSRLSIGAGPSGDSEIATAMLFLSGVALSVLLIASLNLANMLIARGTAREREVAIRFALGSSRWRVVRLLLVESGVIALVGGALGLAASVAGTRLLAVRLASALPYGIAFDATPDARVLVATFGFALVSGLACGLGPALRLARAGTLSHLKDQAGVSRASLRNVLVVIQLTTCLALLTAGGLFVRGALAAAGADPGFSLERGIVAAVSADLAGYGQTQGRQAYDRALARLRAHPGIASASIASAIPFDLDADAAGVRAAAGGAGADVQVALVSAIGADYFRTLGAPLLRGREFRESEERAATDVRAVVVDQVLAARLWPGADPLGQRLQMEHPAGWSEALEVVGVARGIRQSLFDSQAPAHLYLPAGGDYHGRMYLHVRLRSAGRPAAAAMVRSVRTTVHEADPVLAILGVDTLRGHRDASIYAWIARAGAGLFGAFAASALVLAGLGVYGVKAYLVSRRRREIAVRMALGATSRDVLRLIVGDGLVLTACGLACGLALSLGLSRLLGGWVYGAGGFDLLPLAAAAATLGAASLLACYAPVRRATRRSPWTMLRAE